MSSKSYSVHNRNNFQAKWPVVYDLFSLIVADLHDEISCYGGTNTLKHAPYVASII